MWLERGRKLKEDVDGDWKVEVKRLYGGEQSTDATKELRSVYIHIPALDRNRNRTTPPWRGARKKKCDSTSPASATTARPSLSGRRPQLARRPDFCYANHGVGARDKERRTNGASRGEEHVTRPRGLRWERRVIVRRHTGRAATGAQ